MSRKDKKPAVTGYDYSTREAREVTVNDLFHRAKSARTAVEIEWMRCNDYYNGIHDVTKETMAFCRDNDLPWVPANMPDPWIMVESQIDPAVPEEWRMRLHCRNVRSCFSVISWFCNMVHLGSSIPIYLTYVK